MPDPELTDAIVADQTTPPILDDAAPPTAIPEEPPAEVAPPAEQFQSIREAAGGYDYDLGAYENDEDAFRHLIDRSRDYDRQQDTIRQYEQMLAQQQVAPPVQPEPVAVPATDAAPQWGWTPPAYNPMWLSQAERDPESGQLRPVNGGTPTQLAQLQNFLDYRSNHMDRFWTDGPYKYMQPYIEQQFDTRQEKFEAMVQEKIDSAMGNHRAQNEADKFLSENGWVYQRDANDQVIRNTISGEAELSPDGKMFAKFMTDAEQGGFPRASQQKYAMDMLKAHQVTTGQAGAVPVSASKKTQFLQEAAGFSPSAAGSETNRTPDTDGVPPAQNPNMELSDMLMANMRAEGITDKDLAETY